MAEAIATEGVDHDDDETDEPDFAEIQIKGSLKTDEVKASHSLCKFLTRVSRCEIGTISILVTKR